MADDDKTNAPADPPTQDQPIEVQQVADNSLPEPDGVAELREQLTAERRRADDATRRADSTDAHIRRSIEDVKNNQLVALTATIDRLEGEARQLTLARREARISADADAEDDIDNKLAEVRHNLVVVRQGKMQLEATPVENLMPRQMPRTPPVAPEYTVDAIAQTLTPRSAAWVRAHPEFATSERNLNRMKAAHFAVVAEGAVPDTEGYFAAVEKHLGIGSSDAGGAASAAPLSSAASGTARQGPAPPAAPPSRNGRGANGNGRTVTLTRDEIEIAKLSGLTPEQYYANKVKH